ncbi:hypothetical protein [Desulforamulus ferrireducens]|uniref:Uncharacterized protein n=1 Tax=Desulforamulus ferrireducens TaxID=1833852 RepID=A0A1S6IWX4_9FIRM|nr:hypothetical protein [Desulforamulus ferrireducens]AQS59274.1 hypothetical protein B0537_09365 [Desulforamulus ferrireducens]
MLRPFKINGIVLNHELTKGNMKRKIIMILLSILLLWALVTLYFYCQHLHKVKRIPLYENYQIGDTTVCLRELRLINYEQIPLEYDNLPWYIELTRHLPQPLIMPYFKMITFYRHSYVFNDEYGTAYLQGYAISKDETRIFGPDKKIDIWLAGPHEVGYLGGNSTMQRYESDNFYFFSCEGRNVPLNPTELTIMVNDKINNKDYKLPLKLNWQTKTYTFFNRQTSHYQNCNPVVKVEEFIDLQEKGKSEKLAQLILAERLPSISWQATTHDYWHKPKQMRLSYYEKYQGLADVISVNITFGEVIDPYEFHGQAQQKFYLVDHRGTWKIIHIGPLEKL